jgi:hypothetical protein
MAQLEKAKYAFAGIDVHCRGYGFHESSDRSVQLLVFRRWAHHLHIPIIKRNARRTLSAQVFEQRKYVFQETL